MQPTPALLSPALRLARGIYALQKGPSTGTVDFTAPEQEEKEKTDFNRIRCPLCQWRPKRWSRWYCADCWDPELFIGGCGTLWNTFATRGRCPGCGHQWRWTSCLHCEGWSLHEDWYVKDDSGPRR